MLCRLKSRIKKITIIKDYLSFKCVYHECSSIYKFLLFRFFPNKMGSVYWPVHPSSEVRGSVFIGIGARVAHRPGCIIQGRGAVFIGNYVGIGPNSVIISGNHSLTSQRDVVRKETIIGDHTWIASSCCILAGVVLGPRTIVGAGSVVTKSFPEGYCVIAGNPAKVVKKIDPSDFVPEKMPVPYYGYIRADKFREYINTHFHYEFKYDISTVSSNEYFNKKAHV